MKAQELGRGRVATAQLLVNGMPMGAPEMITNGKIAFKLPNYGAQTIGREIKKLQIAVTGKAEVQMVGIKVEDQMPSYPQVISSRVHKVVYGSERIISKRAHGPSTVADGRQSSKCDNNGPGKWQDHDDWSWNGNGKHGLQLLHELSNSPGPLWDTCRKHQAASARPTHHQIS